MEQALPVNDCFFDEDIIQSGDISSLTAEEYLSWVRYQAEQLPDVVRVELDNLDSLSKKQTKYMPEIEQIPVCPEILLPNTEWETEVLSSFSELRTLLGIYGARGTKSRHVPVPPMRNSAAWHLFCLGSEIRPTSGEILDEEDDSCEVIEIFGEGESKGDVANVQVESLSVNIVETDSLHVRKKRLAEELGLEEIIPKDEVPDTVTTPEIVYDRNVLPTPSLLMQFDQVLTQALLKHHITWLKESEVMSTNQALWIYSLLARLEKPLFQDTGALIRSLYRRCCELRIQDFDVKKGLGEETDDKIARLNLLIVISGKYFGQAEEYTNNSSNNNKEENENEVDEEEVLDEEGLFEDSTDYLVDGNEEHS